MVLRETNLESCITEYTLANEGKSCNRLVSGCERVGRQTGRAPPGTPSTRHAGLRTQHHVFRIVTDEYDVRDNTGACS